MGREVRWEWMFPDQLEAAFAETPLLYLPFGLCEPHGPHNVLGLDALKAHGLCVRAAERGGGIVAPPDYWHIHEVGLYAAWARREVGEVARHWLTAVPPWVHFKHVCYQIRTAEQLGFHAAILLTGHYGPNWIDLKTIIERIQPFVRVRLHGLPDFEANQPGFDMDGKSSADHAGKVETSLLWALEPDAVDASRLPPLPLEAPGAVGRYFAMGRDAHLADRRVGERMVEDEVRFLIDKGKDLLKAYDGVAPAKGTLLNFEDVERFWDAEIRPIFPTFKSMEGYADGKDMGSIPEDSVWRRASSGPLRS